MDLSSAHSCRHCERVVVDLSGFKDLKPDEHGDVSLPLNLTGRDLQNGAADRCAFFIWLLDKVPTEYRSIVSQAHIWMKLPSGEGHSLSIVFFFEQSESLENVADAGLRLKDMWSKALGQGPNTSRGKPSPSCYFFALDGDPAAAYARRGMPNLSPGSDASLSRAKSWLRQCRDTHGQCRLPAGIQMPTRLLELVSNAANEVPSIRLIQSTSAVDYAALTYCWGGDQACKLLKANIQNRYTLSKIDGQYPKTLQDAILVTRKMGLSYIWIDCLCIIQDDEQDITRELGKMADIYKGATVTISAAIAASSSDGFLQTRKPESWHMPSFKLTVNVSHGTQGTFFIAPAMNYEVRKKGGEPDPIELRAWTLQEHVLSSRILYFGPQQLNWICRNQRLADGGHGIEDVTSALSVRHSYVLPFTPKYSREGDWWNLVQSYSSRQLSHPEDKLIAISAIAKDFSKYFDSAYIAGLWEENIGVQLLWSVEHGQVPRVLPKVYRAPTWSWASVESKIMFFSGASNSDQYQVSKVISWEVELQSALSPFGSIKSASITIHGLMAKAELENRGSGGPVLKVPLDHWEIDTSGSDSDEYWSGKWWSLDSPQETLEGSSRSVWLVWMDQDDSKMERIPNEEGIGSGVSLVGLLLTSTGIVDTNEFRRLGMFSLDVVRKDKRAVNEEFPGEFEERIITMI